MQSITILATILPHHLLFTELLRRVSRSTASNKLMLDQEHSQYSKVTQSISCICAMIKTGISEVFLKDMLLKTLEYKA